MSEEVDKILTEIKELESSNETSSVDTSKTTPSAEADEDDYINYTEKEYEKLPEKEKAKFGL